MLTEEMKREIDEFVGEIARQREQEKKKPKLLMAPGNQTGH